MRLTLSPGGKLFDTDKRQQRQLQQARRAGLTEIPVEDVGRIRFGYLEVDGIGYRIRRGLDPMEHAVAFFIDGDRIVWLERTP